MGPIKTLLSLGLLTACTLAMPGQFSGLNIRQGSDPEDIMMFDCTDYDGGTLEDLCTNMCFGSFCAGNGQSLVWDNPTASVAHKRARAAGCRTSKGSPCDTSVDECDEFPFKSVKDTGGTRIYRCVPARQNQDQAQIIKAFYSKSGYCKHEAPCSFNTGYENSGEIKYCNKKTCKNDGNEYTKGGLYPQARSASNDSSSVVLFDSPDVSPINWPTRFQTADDTEVVVPTGAVVGQNVTRIRVNNVAAWNEYITGVIAAQANMTETEYWQNEVAPASPELLALVTFEQTTITAQLPDY